MIEVLFKTKYQIDLNKCNEVNNKYFFEENESQINIIYIDRKKESREVIGYIVEESKDLFKNVKNYEKMDKRQALKNFRFYKLCVNKSKNIKKIFSLISLDNQLWYINEKLKLVHFSSLGTNLLDGLIEIVIYLVLLIIAIVIINVFNLDIDIELMIGIISFLLLILLFGIGCLTSKKKK